MMAILHWLLYITGGTDGSGPIYLEWSGFVGNLGLFGFFITWYRRNKCKECWRIAHHPVEGTPYKTCHKHATHRIHDRLHVHHEIKHPDQHKFLDSDIIKKEQRRR